MPSGGLSRVRRKHARALAAGSHWPLWRATDRFDRLPDSGLPPAAPGGGSLAGAGFGNRHQLGKHTEVLGRSQSSGTPEGPMGRVPPEDIVGAFAVKGGQLCAYQPNDKHLVFSKNGLVQLPPSLAEIHVRELKRLKVG